MSKLKGLARTLAQTARAGGFARRPLRGGLHLTLRHDAGEWSLSLTRHGTHASDIERRICREAFGVPEGAGCEIFYNNGYGVTRYTWGRAEQLGLGLAVPEAVRYE
jgi:hypothetical protein